MELGSDSEAVNIPMLPTKFLYLKHLTIQIAGGTFSPSYDYFFLVSFVDASPSLETLYLDVCQDDMAHESIIESSSPHLRQLPELSHDCLKSVKILGFNSAKSLVELTCGIVKAAVSLERLVLDTLRGGDDRCCGESNGKICWPVSNAVLKESARAAIAVRRYIEDKVSPITTLTLVEPCTRCHSLAFG
ncbi:Os02g0105600 [Oryza sativa Japonica Group]|uniref:Os02g0105600 protein n=1 Tax=Oryza sativa subsp. japonica TaxID=39947 RepID=Q0E4Q2_ORYSJ|nr:Os02g0105600 [Oryza sativa Japonica Group]|eukprot:NP_001045622.1 Os02g0105600 [Oryza sativa Japonica Group]